MPLVAQTPLTAGGGFEPDGNRQRLWACPCQAGTWGTRFWRSVWLLLALFRLSSRTGKSRTDGPCGLSAAPGPKCDEHRRRLDLWQAPPALRLPLAVRWPPRAPPADIFYISRTHFHKSASNPPFTPSGLHSARPARRTTLLPVRLLRLLSRRPQSGSASGR